MMKNFCIILFILLSPAAMAQQYLFKSEIFIEEKLVASPEITTELDNEVAISVEDLYHLELTASRAEQDMISISAKIQIAGREFQPTIVTPLGEFASIELGEFKWKLIVTRK